MGNTLTCISPVDASVYAERPALSKDAAFAAVARAKTAQAEWAKQPLQDRIDLVMAGVAAIGAQNDEIVPELAKMMGRPLRYGGEFGGFNEHASHMAGIAVEGLADIEFGEDEPFKPYIKRVPHGVVFVVAPWNYPHMTAINTVAPALIAGNAVILKHATQTLLVGERMANAFMDAGVPADVFQNLFLSYDVTSDLIAANAFDFVNFTGSVPGGQAMERAAAGTFTGVGTKLGGKDPGYVAADADLNAAVDTLIDGAMFNSGQCCCGNEWINVHESLFDEFGLTTSIWTNDIDRAQRIGDQLETGTVFMNRADYLDPGLCWCGTKNTGREGALSVIGYHNLTRPKSYHLKKVTT